MFRLKGRVTDQQIPTHLNPTRCPHSRVETWRSALMPVMVLHITESREESGDFSREEKRENEDSQQLLTALLPPKPTSFWKKMVVFTKLYRLRNFILEIVDS